MDYTTLAIARQVIRIEDSITKDDALLTRLVTAASRTTDRICAGSSQAVDYFKSETITLEKISGQVDVEGRIRVWPHKSLINSVSAFQYRFNPLQDWQVVDSSMLEVDNNHSVLAYPALSPRQRGRVFCKVTYNGGHATSTAGLPEDFVEVVTMLVARFYREDESGLTDAIGVAELGTVQFTMSFPIRYKDTIANYMRRVPW